MTKRDNYTVQGVDTKLAKRDTCKNICIHENVLVPKVKM